MMTKEIVHAPCPQCGCNEANLCSINHSLVEFGLAWWVCCTCGYETQRMHSPDDAWARWASGKEEEKTMGAPEPTVSQLLHRSVVMRLTDERDAARRQNMDLVHERDATKEEVQRMTVEVQELLDDQEEIRKGGFAECKAQCLLLLRERARVALLGYRPDQQHEMLHGVLTALATRIEKDVVLS